MSVTRFQALRNGFMCRCPNCGGRTLFQGGRMFKVNASCPACGLRIETGDGAFLGPFVINYGITAFGIIVPVLVLYASGRLGATASVSIALVAGLAAPLVLYRLSWGWWLMVYYFFLPGSLPANLGAGEGDDQ